MKTLNNQDEEAHFELNEAEKAMLLKKIELARNQIKNGESLTAEELHKEMESWFNESE